MRKKARKRKEKTAISRYYISANIHLFIRFSWYRESQIYSFCQRELYETLAYRSCFVSHLILKWLILSPFRQWYIVDNGELDGRKSSYYVACVHYKEDAFVSFAYYLSVDKPVYLSNVAIREYHDLDDNLHIQSDLINTPESQEMCIGCVCNINCNVWEDTSRKSQIGWQKKSHWLENI